MKKTFALLFVSFIAFNLHAQLSNTKWKGTLSIQGGINVLFNFTHDTLDVTNADSGESIETMKYNLEDSVLTIQKLWGNSQCDTTSGKYRYSIKDNQLTLSLIKDDCYDRAEAIGTMILEKKE